GWVGDRAGGRVGAAGEGPRPLSLPSLPPSPTLSPCRLDERGRGRVRTDPPTRQARSLTLLLGSGWVPNPSPQDATDRCGERKMPVSPAPTVPDFSVPLPVAPSGPSSPGGFWWKAHRGEGGGWWCVRDGTGRRRIGVYARSFPVSNFLVSPVPHPSTHTFIRAVVGMSGWMEARDAVDHARQDLHHSKKGCL
ncbi:hypothetical protein EG867_16425, partial [Enterococcus faecalis]